MPLSNPTKKAMAFAVTILCSLASVGVGDSMKPKENPPMMHDSLYDSWVATAYNALPNDPDIDPCLDGFYAPVYFSNLRSNFGTNRFGTCAFVAMGMLLSFYDTYWDDSIVPSAYEAVATSAGDPVNGSIDSPGSCDSLPIIGNSNASYYLNTIVPQNDGVYLDMKLMTLASDYQVAFNADTSETGLDYSGMYSLFQYYLYTYRGFSPYELGFIAETGTGAGQARSESVRDFAIEKVSEGIPVLLSVGTDYASTTGRHAVIAYDYDEDNDLLYCHMGWGPKATHVTIESFGYTSYNSAFSLAVRTQHSHTDNYKKVISGYCLSSHCACEFAAPYDIRNVDWYRNEEPGFEWSCVDNEKWAGDFLKYEISIPGCMDYDEAVEKRWSVPWILKNNTENQNTFIYDSSTILVTVNALYDNDYYNLSSIERSASFSGPTDFSGAHNVHPGDYAFSPNSPAQTGTTDHSVDGFSFKTSRKGVYEDQDQGMVSLFYAGSWFDDAYIQYHNFPQGDAVIGLDIGIRLWEDTNAAHGLSIEYYDVNSQPVSADLLDDAYGISGSDGDACWVHYSFGAPVSAFSIHAFSSGASYYDDGVAGLLTVAIYTVHNGKLPTSGSELPYSPGLWNDCEAVQGYSNCYRYALNFPCLTNVQHYWEPGEYSNTKTSNSSMEKEDLLARVMADFFEYKSDHPSSDAYFAKIGRLEACPSGCYKVALFVAEHLNGFHWMRQNYDGTWSHKNSSDPVTNLDESESPMVIIDPQFCETRYNYFCGYYCVGPWTGYGVS